MNHEAIYATHPQVKLIRGDEAFDAGGNPVIYNKAAVQSYIDAHGYIEKRQMEYPALADLADAMYWASQGDNTKLDNYYAACEAVKLKYPKS